MAEINLIKFRKELNEILVKREEILGKSLRDNNDAMYETIQVPEASEIDPMSEGTHAQLPLTVKTHVNTVKEYTTDLIKMDNPILLDKNYDLTLLAQSYNKREDIYRQISNRTFQKVHEIAMREWGATTNIVETSGTGTRTTSLVGASGSVKKIAKADLLKVNNIFNKMGTGDNYGDDTNTRFAMFTPDQINDLYEIEDLTQADKDQILSLKNRTIRGISIFGWTIMMRWDPSLGSIGLSYTNAGVKKLKGEAVASTDKAAAIFWDSRFVRSSMSPLDIVINERQAQYAGGTIIYGDCRFGATKKRTDETGIVTLLEKVSS
jgi:hypothetical protein